MAETLARPRDHLLGGAADQTLRRAAGDVQPIGDLLDAHPFEVTQNERVSFRGANAFEDLVASPERLPGLVVGARRRGDVRHRSRRRQTYVPPDLLVSELGPEHIHGHRPDEVAKRPRLLNPSAFSEHQKKHVLGQIVDVVAGVAPLARDVPPDAIRIARRSSH